MGPSSETNLRLERLVDPLLYYVGLSLFLFPETLYWAMDGAYYVNWTRQLFQYSMAPLDHSAITPLEGMGALLPPVAVWIHPGWLPFQFPLPLADPQVVYI